MPTENASRGLFVLRIAIGVFFVFEALGKVTWLYDAGILRSQLLGWRGNAGVLTGWYLDAVCIPGAAVFARLVFLGEGCAGLALLGGVYTRVAASLAFLMVLNFHFASSAIFRYQFLTNGFGLPVLGGLLALAIAGQSVSWNRTGPKVPSAGR